MRPSGGLLGEICIFFKVLEAFLKGRIEAIMAMVDHGQLFKILYILMKFIWKVNHYAFLMILIAPGGRLAKVRNRNCQFQ